MPPKPALVKRKADALDAQPMAKSTGDPGPDGASHRPVRTTRGQGGRVEQLTNFTKEIEKKQMGSNNGAVLKDLPINAPINPLAPPEKKQRLVKPKMVCLHSSCCRLLLILPEAC